MFRTVSVQQSLWESVLPEELQRLPEELARVDVLLDDRAFFTPFVLFFDPRMGRPSTPMETYLRLMFLKFRYRLGYEALCREVSDSITWRRFCRIPLDGRVPHPTTLMKMTTRCGAAAVDGLNEALLAKAAEAKLLRTNRIRVDTTVVAADVGYPTDSGLLAKAVGSMTRTVERIKAAGGAVRTGLRDRRRSAGRQVRSIMSKLRLRGAQQRVAHRGRAAQGPAAPSDQPSRRPDDTHPASDGSNPQPSRRGDARVGEPAGQPARCRRAPDPQRSTWQAGGVRL